MGTMPLIYLPPSLWTVRGEKIRNIHYLVEDRKEVRGDL
jgi:hypothetical protein